MGAVRKFTGQQAQLDLAKENAARQEAAAKAAADAASRSAAAQARAAADSQAQAVQRSAAEQKASDVMAQPLQSAEVDVNAPAAETATAASRRRRSSFGQTYNTGVSL